MLRQILGGSMKVPSPSYREYVKFVATALATFAVLQYTGIFFENAGRIDWTYLPSVGVLLPICAYLLAVILENIEWVSQWGRMVQNEE